MRLHLLADRWLIALFGRADSVRDEIVSPNVAVTDVQFAPLQRLVGLTMLLPEVVDPSLGLYTQAHSGAPLPTVAG